MKCEYAFFLPSYMLPKGFKYPEPYVRFVSAPLSDLTPWNFFYGEPEPDMEGLNHLEAHFRGLQTRYPERTVVPFARRQDNDDIACFDASYHSDDVPVIIIHDFASPGWENRGEFSNFTEWLQLAREDAKEWQISEMMYDALCSTPWVYGLDPDDEGWVSIRQLLEAFKRRDPKWASLTIENLEQWNTQHVGEHYQINADKIRNSHFYNMRFKLPQKKADPPSLLYYATDQKLQSRIISEGLKPFDYQYIHLLTDPEIAHQIAELKTSKPIILSIEANRAYFDGVTFYKGNEKEWLADYIPPQYIQKISSSE